MVKIDDVKKIVEDAKKDILDKMGYSEKNKGLHAHVILDRSGSMGSIRMQTIDSVNEYINSLKEANDKIVFSLTLFDTTGANELQLDRVYSREPIKEVKLLTKNDYVPRGLTPLNDSIGMSIKWMEEKLYEKNAVVVLTDGYENASSEWTNEMVKKLLTEKEESDNWLVIYLGANQDAFSEGLAKGFKLDRTMNYDVKNIDKVFRAATRATMAYNSTGAAASVSFTDEEREESK